MRGEGVREETVASRFLAGTGGGQGVPQIGIPGLLGTILSPQAADTANVCDMFVDTFFSSTNC